MYFIGQRHIMNQLNDILPHLYETGEGMSILLRGPSGWGKTTMAFKICNYLTGGEFNYCLGDKIIFRENFKVHFIDEIHLLPTPEILYPLMDSGKYVIVLATNDAATLQEALVNRTVEFIFDKYSPAELREICKAPLGYPVNNECLDYIVESAGGNPRIIKNIVSRLNIILNRRPGILKDISLNSFKALMKESFGIVDGLDIICVRYLEALISLGGRASLQTLGTFLHVDQNTLRFYVEPILLYKNRIQITSKGRSLIWQQ